jgi:hypothetical protein
MDETQNFTKILHKGSGLDQIKHTISSLKRPTEEYMFVCV